MKLKFSSVALAVTLAAASFGAQASLIGMADLTITQLLLRNSTPVSPGVYTYLTPADINIVGGSRVSNNNAVLNGSLLSSSAGAGAVGDANAIYECNGACGSPALLAAYASGGGLSDNTTTHILTPIVPALKYALGDSKISGSALAGGAAGFTRADSELSGPKNSSSANGNLANEVAAKFTAATSRLVDFQVTYDALVRTFIDAQHYGVTGASSVLATNQFTVSVFDETDGVDLLFAGAKTWSPVDLNRSGSTNTAINGTAKNFASSGTIYSPSVLLLSGHDYSLNITQNSSVILRSVPEPASMLLIGLGLAAIGFASRRRA
ncbi:MAG: PEP-CTERM sorting domain-containing protein [Pseudomonadota bacterium]|nr:PEP-CTERM sorting domain-containing protein [Pseudomonadota bacterium]